MSLFLDLKGRVNYIQRRYEKSKSFALKDGDGGLFGAGEVEEKSGYEVIRGMLQIKKDSAQEGEDPIPLDMSEVSLAETIWLSLFVSKLNNCPLPNLYYTILYPILYHTLSFPILHLIILFTICHHTVYYIPPYCSYLTVRRRNRFGTEISHNPWMGMD